MDIHFSMFLSIITICFFFLTSLPPSRGREDDSYRACNTTYICGSLINISYPFWGEQRPRYCGRSDEFNLTCEKNQSTSIQVGSENFKVMWIDQFTYTMRMVRRNLVPSSCPSNFTITSLNPALFFYRPQTVENMTVFYNCDPQFSNSLPREIKSKNNFTCRNESGGEEQGFYVNETQLQTYGEGLRKCEVKVQIPVLRDVALDSEGGIESLNAALAHGFDVQYITDPSCSACYDSGGMCGSRSSDTSQFSCYCQDGVEDSTCHKHGNPINYRNKVIIGVAASVVTGLAMLIAFYMYQRRKKNRYAKAYIKSESISSISSVSLKDLEKGSKSKYFGLPVFSYDELEEATNNFDSEREIGDGGFGTVYFGKLRDGRYVAVKRLYENNYRRLEQFKNEVEILAAVRHQNLVSLYGCTSRHSRELLLVYEYIPNGTVADHLHGQRAKAGNLSWDIRMNIAIETASAIAYLHASVIIHRDVKTNNILLDNHFSVKVADFGLSRLFPDNVTHISTAPQGTPGYVDPEYHECYQLTDKSDVFSFGVVLIELISSMPAVDITRHRHEINLSSMAINKIQNRALHELVDPNLGYESDYKVRKEINAVAELAFQCLQCVKDMRPTMEEVLEKLKDIHWDGKDKSKAEEMDISADEVVLLKNQPPPASPDSNMNSSSTTQNDSR